MWILKWGWDIIVVSVETAGVSSCGAGGKDKIDGFLASAGAESRNRDLQY